MRVEPYLVFHGRTDEAIGFYKKAVGAEVTMLMRFKEMPGPVPPGAIPEGAEDKVMHSCVKIGDSNVMMSDGRCIDQGGFAGFSLAYQAADPAAADRVFSALSDGGTVTMPLTPTFWSQKFGMVTDKFGVSWMVNVVQEQK